MWNELIKIRDKAIKSVKFNNDGQPNLRSKKMMDIFSKADLLLKQMNTAGGKELMKDEAENFINGNKNLLK